MKRVCCAALCLCLILLLTSAAFAAENTVVVNGDWSVRIPFSPTVYERFAAEKLCDVLSDAFGTAVPVAVDASEPYIAVGSASRADVSDLPVNSYRIRVLDGCIHIDGTGERGLQAGVYRFLEEFCGRKVYAPDLIVLPNAEAIVVPADTDIVYTPFFEYTETDWRTRNIEEYSMANGLFGGIYRTLPAAMGGAVRYLAFAHTMRALCETEKYAQSHPEYLALHDGVRTTAQPCLSQTGVLEIATQNVLSLLQKSHDPEASLQIVSVSQNDNYDYCQCAECRAFEDAHGGVPSAVILHFVNQIADAVKAAGYDNVAIDTFAYQYSRKAPVGIVPRDNVIVRLCTIECCFCHTLDDPSCPRNAAMMQDLRDWSAICKRLYIWDYTTNYANTCLVFPDFDVIQRNIQIFCEHNVKGVYEEGNFYLSRCDAEFGDLRMYMIAKCLQNPYCDLAAETDGFLAAYYGKGWRQIRRAIGVYSAHAGDRNGHLGIYCRAKGTMQLTYRNVRTIDCCWKKAKAASLPPTQQARIERSELSWRFWKASVNKGEFSFLNPDRFAEKEQLFNDLQTFGVTTLSEGGDGDYLDCACVRYAPADAWNGYEADSVSVQRRVKLCGMLETIYPYLTLHGLLYRLVCNIHFS